MKALKQKFNLLKHFTWQHLFVFILVILAFYFRIQGISDNHSFWADESYVSSFARDVVEGKSSLIEVIKIQDYQPLHVVLITLFFKLFGISEFSARLPFVLFGTLGVVGAYLVVARLSTVSAGLLAAFIYSFAQINLANSTQAKPYTVIETAFLFILYFILRLENSPNRAKVLHLAIIGVATLSSLTHFVGFLVWIPYIVFIIMKHGHKAKMLLQKPLYLIITLIALTVFFFLFKVNLMLKLLFTVPDHNIFFINNNIPYLRELLWKNYGFITLPAIIGAVLLLKKNRYLGIGIILWAGTLIYLWTFRSYTHNIRYLLPIFGVLFVCFSIFWGETSKVLFNKKHAFICLGIAMMLFIGGNKFVRKPSTYYTPNADFTADIQIADYKTLYLLLEKRFPQLDNIVVYNNVVDSQIWYLPYKLPDATFMKDYTTGLEYGGQSTSFVTGKPIFTSLKQFQEQMKLHPKGVVIVEDWESILPEEIKQFAKRNLKLEIRVEGLPQAEGDNWPLEVYSWGM